MKKVLILLIILLIPFKVSAETKSIIDLNNLTIEEIQEAVDSGYINYETIMNIYLERIEAYDKDYNAYITVNENALKEAKKCDQEMKKTSLIYCLPIVVKDNIDVKGMPTTAGAKGLDDNYPKENAPIVQKLIDAGAIIIGKANMDEFAIHADRTYSSYGYTYNAYNTLYSSYGSSGGVAVAVAANLAVAGIGTDTGSSIRIPSSANGLVGLRPSTGTIDMGGIILFEETRDVAGPITKYVEDNAIMLEIIDNKDTEYKVTKSDLKGIRIGVLNSYMNPNTNGTGIATGKTDRSVYNLMQKAISDLKSLGAEIVDLSSLALPYKFDASTLCMNFNNYLKGTTGTVRSLNDLIRGGEIVSSIGGYNSYCSTDYHSTSTWKSYVAYRNSNIARANNYFKNNNVDALIYPTLKTELIKVSELWSKNLYTPSSNIAPLVGFPSMNVQIGYHNNLPYGMEILSQANKEDLIYKIAYNYQNVNNYYTTPTIAPSLYEIPENIEIIKGYLNETNTNKYYQDFYQKVGTFIKEYPNAENVEEEITSLIQEHDNIPNLIEKDKQEKIKQERIKYMVIAISTFIVLISIILLRKGKHEKTKRTR